MPPERRDDRRTDGHVGHEVAVHDVDVEPVGRGGHLSHLFGQGAEVRGEERRRDAQVTGLPRVRMAPVSLFLYRIHVQTSLNDAQLKRAQQRMRLKP